MADPRQWPEVWIFDLDNTLYPPEAGLLAQIDRRIVEHIVAALGVSAAEANRLRRIYWERFGVTLTGLVEEHGVDAADFLDDVHAVDLSALTPDPDLVTAIGRLPGRKIVHTNGARAYAERVLRARGLDGAFEAVFGIEDKGLVGKPAPAAYAVVIAETGLEPRAAVMIEDMAVNLLEPKRLGMGTVWLDHADEGPEADHVDHRITDLQAFLDARAGLREL